MRLLFVSFMLSLFWPFGAFSRTWYVRNDGTGDAPTIQAAVDSAMAGDTIFVGPGMHMYSLPVIIEAKDSLTVMSDAGPNNTLAKSVRLNFASHILIGFTFESCLSKE